MRFGRGAYETAPPERWASPSEVKLHLTSQLGERRVACSLSWLTIEENGSASVAKTSFWIYSRTLVICLMSIMRCEQVPTTAQIWNNARPSMSAAGLDFSG